MDKSSFSRINEVVKAFNRWQIAFGLAWLVAGFTAGPWFAMTMFFDFAPGQELPFWARIPFYIAIPGFLLVLVMSNSRSN